MKKTKSIRMPTTGTCDFEKLILDKKAKYIDKTALLYELARHKSDAQLFISRPRRFGKSLMLSTLQAMFEGRRKLFKGLAIDNLPWEGWEKPTPVYSFSMRKTVGGSYELFHERLAKLVKSLCAQAKMPFDAKTSPVSQFGDLLSSAPREIVVLIDDADSPLTEYRGDQASRKRIEETLLRFYEHLKTNSSNIRLLMMTGVAKLPRPDTFSGFNTASDISMYERFATLLGYTPDELDGALRENVQAFSEKNGMDFKEAKAALLSWYGGYRFSPDSEARVCNPVSLGSAFKSGKLKGYWERPGQTSLVINRIVRAGKMPCDIENVSVYRSTLDVCDAKTLPMEALLYQGGYLTIKDVIRGENPDDPDSYVLAPPNREVRDALKRGYLSQVMGLRERPFDALVDRAKRLIREGDFREVVETMLFSLYAQVPPDWQIKNEAEAKRYFQLFFAMIGANPAPEFPSARGYADAVVETPQAVCVFEFKYAKSAKAAIRQIRERGYADKWIGGKRPVTLVGINFNPRKRNIDLPIIESP